jgi:hypothetical protein
MNTTHRTRVSSRTRKYRSHGGLPKLAAQLAGCSVKTVYKVIDGHTTSATVERAIEEAERQLARKDNWEGRVA